MQNGDVRFCEGHKEICDAKLFPYKGADLCLYCYEKEHGRTLHSFRKKLGIKDEYKKISRKNSQTKEDKNFVRENSLDEILDYLKQCEKYGRGVEFYYKDKPTKTIFSSFRIVDNNHIQCFSSYGRRRKAYTYRIDRIRKI